MLIEIHKKHVIETKVSDFGNSSFIVETAAACLLTFCRSAYVGQSDNYSVDFYGCGTWNVSRYDLERLAKKLHESSENEIVQELIEANIVDINDWCFDTEYLQMSCEYNTLVRFIDELLEHSDKGNETIYFDVDEY